MRTDPASLLTVVETPSTAGPIATESIAVTAGVVDDDPSTVVGSAPFLNDNNGSLDESDVDIAGAVDSLGFWFSEAISETEAVVVEGGGMVGIETSLRRPCDSAPFVLELLRSLISMGLLEDSE